MDQPIFWTGLLAVSVFAAVVRWSVGRPLLARHAIPIGRVELLVAGLSVLVLVFHCTAMFFGSWVDAVPGAVAPADAVRSLGTASQLSYWVPVVVLVSSWRRIWWPALALLIVTLTGVGVTMFWPYALATHLAWLAAAVLVGVFISVGLLRYSFSGARPSRRRPARLS
ncbi:MAG: hypothetical protein L0H64_13505 [Pseudonocardia sp.]|nr:hypothetical protein [Pseudonocardia sp.]